MEIEPIAHVYTDFPGKFGVPRQSGRVASARGKIVFLPPFRREEALRGIEAFSHLWLLFDFSLSHRGGFSPTVRPPRLGGNERVGVFASRSPFRPNPLGLSCVELLSVESTPSEGPVLIVGGVDLVDGTPLFDVKPYVPYSDCRPGARGGYAEREKDHALAVSDPLSLLSALPADKRQTLLACISDDPRPSYRDDPEREYGMLFAGFDVGFTVEGDRAKVTRVTPLPGKDGPGG